MDANALLSRYESLKSERLPLEQRWRETAHYMRPMQEEFGALWTGERHADLDPYITDSSAFLAVDNLTGGLYGFLTNDASNWFDIETFDDDLNQFHSVKLWLHDVTRKTLRSFGPAMSNFYHQVPDLYADALTFGFGVFLSEPRAGTGKFHDTSISIADVHIDTNDHGEVDAVFRLMRLTPQNAAKKFGKEKLSAKLQAKLDRPSTDKHEFVHVVTPREDYREGAIGPRGFPFVDVYIEIDGKQFVREGGREEMPFMTPRWSGRGKYGVSLGGKNLPDVKMLNAMDRAVIEMAEFQARPAVLAADEDSIRGLRPVPGKVTYGAINSRGGQMVQFLSPTGSLSQMAELTSARREQIREAFIFGLMQLSGRTGMNPIETMERQEDKMRLMGPNLARMQTEFLSPLISRRVAMLSRAGVFADPPEELAGQTLRIQYVSPMARAHKAAEATATMRFVESLAGVMQLDPQAGDLLNGDETVAVIREGFGAPTRVMNSPEAIQAKRKARAAQQQAAAAAQAATVAADVGQKVAAMQPEAAGA